MAEKNDRKAREAREKKRAEERKRQQEAKAKAEAQKKTEEERKRQQEAKAEPRRDWTEDLGGLVRGTAGAAADLAKKAGGALVNEDAWKRLAPGGEKARVSDFANAALDASLLIPGAGAAGLAARGGAKILLKQGGREAAERTLSPLAARVAGQQAAGGGARKLGAEGAEQAATTAGRHAAARPGARKLAGATGTARKDAGEALARVGTASERAGRGTKIGMAQSGKRLAANTAASVGANLLTEAYDSGFGSRAPEGGPAPAAVTPGPSGPNNGVGVAAGMPGMYALMAADGTLGPTAPSAQQAIAGYMNMGGSPDGSQVIYLGR